MIHRKLLVHKIICFDEYLNVLVLCQIGSGTLTELNLKFNKIIGKEGASELGKALALTVTNLFKIFKEVEKYYIATKFNAATIRKYLRFTVQ